MSYPVSVPDGAVQDKLRLLSDGWTISPVGAAGVPEVGAAGVPEPNTHSPLMLPSLFFARTRTR